MWYVYIVKCKDKTLYTGITNNVAERIKQHNLKKASKYTRMRVPVKLFYQESHPTKSSALKREYQIKSWSKTEKESLISKKGGSP